MKEEQVVDDTTVCVAFLGNFPQGEPLKDLPAAKGSPDAKK